MIYLVSCLIVMVVSAVTAGVLMYLEIRKLRAERVAIEAWASMIVKQCHFYDADKMSHEMPLTDHEVSNIKERRLRIAGARYCQSCGKIAGLRYRYKDGSVKGITIQNVNVNGVQELRCTSCIPEAAQSKGGK